MNSIIPKHISAVKKLIEEGNNMEIDELGFLVEQERAQFEHDLDKELKPGELTVDGEQIVLGLLTKLGRIFPIDNINYARDPESLLACIPDYLGMGPQEQRCCYEEDSFPDIQKDIFSFLSARAQRSEWISETPLLSGDPMGSYSEMKRDVMNNISRLSRDFVDYIKYYYPDFWNWRIDLIVLSQYVFEKAIELTVRLMEDDNIQEYYYDIREAFSFYELPIPEKLQNSINSSVSQLEDIIGDVASYVEDKDYQTCELGVWLYPIFFTVGVIGMQFAIEKK